MYPSEAKVRNEEDRGEAGPTKFGAGKKSETNGKCGWRKWEVKLEDEGRRERREAT
jgi:hypothetical protein